MAVMIGAKNFGTIEDGVSFQFMNGKYNAVQITLNGLDLYNVRLIKMRGMQIKKEKQLSNIFAGNLKSTIESETGLAFSL